MEEFLADGSLQTENSPMGKIMWSMLRGLPSEFLDLIQEFTLAELEAMRDGFERSLLHHAACEKNVFYSAELLKLGFDSLLGDHKDYLPIHYAAMNGFTEHLQLFYEKEPAALETKSNQYATPLIVAIQHNQVQAVQVLLALGANANAELSDGYTALHSAVHIGEESVIQALLEQPGLEINAQTNEGITPLMLACHKQLDIVKALRAKRANPNLKAKDGTIALDIAVKKDDFPLCDLLFDLRDLSANTIKTAHLTHRVQKSFD